MVAMYCCFGILMIVSGFQIKKQKWMWFVQGQYPIKSGDVEKYCQLMSKLSIVSGAIIVIATFTPFHFELVAIGFVLYLVGWIYAKNVAKIKN